MTDKHFDISFSQKNEKLILIPTISQEVGF